VRLWKCGVINQNCQQEVWLDQEDAALLKEGEEVTLMDWGNAIIKACSCPVGRDIRGCLFIPPPPSRPLEVTENFILTPASLGLHISFATSQKEKKHTTWPDVKFSPHTHLQKGECMSVSHWTQLPGLFTQEAAGIGQNCILEVADVSR
jgi:hypothetical protein